MSPAKRRTLFERLAALDPHPKSELEYSTPFELLVSVVLSAQATDKGVNKATAKLYRVANTPAAIVKLGIDRLIPYISSIGLYRNKAKNVVALSEIIVREPRAVRVSAQDEAEDQGRLNDVHAYARRGASFLRRCLGNVSRRRADRRPRENGRGSRCDASRVPRHCRSARAACGA